MKTNYQPLKNVDLMGIRIFFYKVGTLYTVSPQCLPELHIMKPVLL